MSDDETAEKTLAFLAKVPKNISEMTDVELLDWAQVLSDRLNPADRRSAQVPESRNPAPEVPSRVTNDVAELNSDRTEVERSADQLSEVVSVLDVMEFLIDHPENVGNNIQRTDSLKNVEPLFPAALEKLVRSGRRWVVIVEPLNDPTKYVQILITSAGSIWAECVSNNFLDDEHQLDEAQCELLPTLGWVWPGPPALPNWHLHDELLNNGPVMSGIMIRTLRRVFCVENEDKIRVVTREVKEKVDAVEQGPHAVGYTTDVIVPGPDARWWSEINEFALTFNAYSRGSGFEAVALVDEQARRTWNNDGTLPSDLDVCRTILFFEQRRFHHLDCEPVGDDDRFIRAVLGQIRALSEGRGLGPSDPAP